MPPVEIIDLTLSSPERQDITHSNQFHGNLSKRSRSPSSSPIENKRRSKRRGNLTLKEPDKQHAEFEDDLDAIFFVDLNPHPSTSRVTLPMPSGQSQKLLLPQHVTVLAGTPLDIHVDALSDVTDDEEFIKYIDYEVTKGAVRYFDQASDEGISVVRTVCKNCGAEGLHKTTACPVQICLTCGAKDEHSTRSCPISKICFSCGMKGHVNAGCPNRRTSRVLLSEHKCNRCSAPTHKTNECPTWWRLYEYLSAEGREEVLKSRQQKRDMKLGEGGEGYVADDEWCYNCGGLGHWGDDCGATKYTIEPEECSAFSKANVMNGPFYTPNDKQRPIVGNPRLRNWEQVDKLSVMSDVGRKGRLKTKVALEKQAMEAEHADDDWFAKGGQRNNRSTRHNPQRQTDRNDDRYVHEQRSGRSLFERIQMDLPSRQDSGSKRRESDERFEKTSLEDRKSRHWDRRREYAPRFKGGYDK